MTEIVFLRVLLDEGLKMNTKLFPKCLACSLMGVVCMSASGGFATHHSDSMDRDYSSEQVARVVSKDSQDWTMENNQKQSAAKGTVVYELFEMMCGSTPIYSPSRVFCLCYKISISLYKNVSYSCGVANMFHGTSNTHLLKERIVSSLDNKSGYEIKKHYPQGQNASVTDKTDYVFNYDSYGSTHNGEFEIIEGTYSWKENFLSVFEAEYDEQAKMTLTENELIQNDLYSLTQDYEFIHKSYGNGNIVNYYGIISFVASALPKSFTLQTASYLLWGDDSNWLWKSYNTNVKKLTFYFPNISSRPW